MSVTAAYFLSKSESFLKEMIQDSEVWRAVVANPDTDWETLQTLIDAQTAGETEAANRIIFGRLSKQEGHIVPLPNVVVRHFDGNTVKKTSTTGWEHGGLMYAGFAFPIPEIYLGNINDAYLDALNKIGGIIEDLAALPLEHPYLHLTQIDLMAFGEEDPVSRGEKEEPFYVAELAIHHIGGVLP